MIKDRNNIPKFLRELEETVFNLALREIGAEGEKELKLTLTKSRPEWPPLKPETIKRKGSTRPLIDTGIMRAKITYRVEGDMVRIGLFGDDNSRGRSGKETVEIGLVHEFGSRDGRIPQRAWMRPTADEKIFPKAEKTIAEKLNRAIEKHSL